MSPNKKANHPIARG